MQSTPAFVHLIANALCTTADLAAPRGGDGRSMPQVQGHLGPPPKAKAMPDSTMITMQKPAILKTQGREKRMATATNPQVEVPVGGAGPVHRTLPYFTSPHRTAPCGNIRTLSKTLSNIVYDFFLILSCHIFFSFLIPDS